MTRETKTGWAASVAVHAILLLIFLLIGIPDALQQQDFIEVTWGAPAVSKTADEPNPAAAQPPSSSPPAVVVPRKNTSAKKASQPVILPERRIPDLSNETFPTVKSEKLDSPEQGNARQNVDRSGVGEREGLSARGVGDRDRSDPLAVPGSSVGVAPGPGGVGEGIGKGVSFSIQWMQGGSRRKISGDLPKYPAGVNVQAQVKILAVVLPNGAVSSTQPAQKADTALEDVAMKEVRFWKFEPLRSSQPQVEQSCVVTFLFTLK